MQDRLTDAAAGAAVLSPFWLRWMEELSAVAAVLLPILGVVWLAVQIWAKIKITYFTTRKSDDKEG